MRLMQKVCLRIFMGKEIEFTEFERVFLYQIYDRKLGFGAVTWLMLMGSLGKICDNWTKKETSTHFRSEDFTQ